MRRWIRLCILAAGLLTSALPAAAQTQRGAGIIMGSLSFSTSSGDLYNPSRTQFQVGPRAYYFATRNLALGGRLMFSSISQGSVNSSALLIGPDLALFWGGQGYATPNVIPELGAGLFLSSLHTDTGIRTHNEAGVTLGLHGGVAIMAGPYLGILPELEVDFENRDGSSGTTILISVGLAGFLY